MDDEEVLSRVRQLRERGSSPKQIARVLGLRPSAVAPLVRRIAEQEQSGVDPAERALLGCWISPGWSAGLGLEKAGKWADLDRPGAAKTGSGLACVLIARRERASRATVCGFLVDVYCLGVKHVTGPIRMGAGSIEAYRRQFFSAFDDPPVPVPVGLAQHVVHGAVAYARTLGFEPPEDFGPAAAYLGAPAEPTPIRFGRDGSPFYISGPYDDPHAVVMTLETTAGPGNYDYIVHVEGPSRMGTQDGSRWD
jgi:hypothetical protein